MSATTNTPLRLTFIGSGQVATHLSLALTAAGHQVQVIYSRQLAHATQLAAQLEKAIPTTSLDFREQPTTDLYIVSVSDAAVAEVVKKAYFPAGSCVVHTSGSLPYTILQRNDLQLQVGVFYPVQTFSRNQPVNFAEIPFALEAPNPALATQLQYLARSISNKVIFMTGLERKQLHLAAVFACNFTNHLLGISQEILTKHKLPPDLLGPLIQTTIQKATQNNPFTVQTGPAVRGDANIIEEHLQLLVAQPIYKQIYQLLSQSIQDKR